MTPDPRQEDMFGHTPEFDGATYDHERDFVRLSGQLSKVYGALQDGQGGRCVGWQSDAEELKRRYQLAYAI